jgi:hypothetical protein
LSSCAAFMPTQNNQFIELISFIDFSTSILSTEDFECVNLA